MPYKNPPVCSIEGCGKSVNARGWCGMHYYRFRQHGDPLAVEVRTRATCVETGCDSEAWAQGLCSKHLTRQRRHGSTDDPRPTMSQRFWLKVNKDGPVPSYRPDLGPCWIWGGASQDLGYGLFFPSRRSPVGAHRYAYLELIGPIPDGFHLDHLCRVPACVNPSHLEPVTPLENTRRGIAARKELA